MWECSAVLIVAQSDMRPGIRTGRAMALTEEAEVDPNSGMVLQAETRPDIGNLDTMFCSGRAWMR